MRTLLLPLACLGLLLSGPVHAQAPQAPGTQATIDPERLAAARDVVRRAQGDRAALLEAMTAPMIGMVRQMGLDDAAKAQVVVREVIMPILAAHYEELLSVQALSFAAVLPKEDLQAIAAFYDTPAGRNLVKVQPQLSQAMLTGMQKWLGTLTGEMQAKIAEAAKAHGWNPGARPKAN
ncbi:DUF2059 domain-containing protein [Methylobacterium trifolii]|uniref:DUF2059 domain-containing protein n=1 Tax=Methylobacterium trifolii TaxID=1003092 RepID=A0ABQ4TUF7_9HYPH|nr:DUF2059 domain-containing protein [Methylobacterium trifolii]GJE58918.1 hypothetical protein MPOCJGCO_1003 [Methylobacterium trifolii]